LPADFLLQRKVFRPGFAVDLAEWQDLLHCLPLMSVITPETFSCETARLSLRPLAAGDEALFLGLYTDQETMRHIGRPLSPGQAARVFRAIMAEMQRNPPSCIYLAMFDRVSHQPLGICGLPRFDAAAIRLEVGLVLIEPARSRGLAREGLAALVDRVFTVAAADEVGAQFSRDNPAARRLVAAVGFKVSDELLAGWPPSPECRWSVLRSYWSGIKPFQPLG
jgi:RimJ/RimL family protein N-acetyltransferase